ncbi:hypothetical protein [Mycobacterium heckeshornense]|uniref:hypothetical protein n=1 Tax=Mycobacterium heckeshornense TaxID=110505 RepID=UPI0011569FF1|nr:hypothetical protein [Mycobacterium heckeshornense]MCV7035719.1 hypothetical protein [Mycobacterium heckeshornense]
MTDPIPHADEVDIAEQSRTIDDCNDEHTAAPNELGESQDADVGDLHDQQLPGPSQDDDDRPAAGHSAKALDSNVFRLPWESNSLTSRRSFIDDMATQNQP